MHEKYKIGSVVLGYVTGIKEYGIFVQLDSNTSGLIHISEISNKLNQCSATTLITVSRILDALIEQQDMLLAGEQKD